MEEETVREGAPSRALRDVCSKEEPKAEVDLQCNNIERQIKRLYSVFEQLEQKTLPILRQEPENDQAEQDREASSVPLADKLCGYSNKLQFLNRQFRKLISKMEI